MVAFFKKIDTKASVFVDVSVHPPTPIQKHLFSYKMETKKN